MSYGASRTAKYAVGAVLLAGLAVLAFNVFDYRAGSSAEPSDFASCAAAGYPVQESFPRRCATKEQTFVEDIGNMIEKDSLIRVSSPLPNASVTLPLIIAGLARGTWYFEASFPVELYAEGASGTPIARGIAEARSDWMTEEFVPFIATLSSTGAAYEGPATLVLKKDNPSGMPEFDDELRIPVVVEKGDEPPKEHQGRACRPTGCSGQICADEDVVTTCEYQETYACYENAVCERQDDGACGWTQTPLLAECLAGGAPVR